MMGRTAELVRFELRRSARAPRSWLGLTAAMVIVAADHLLRSPASRAGDSLFVIAFTVGLITVFRTGWAEDRASAFDELLIPGLVRPHEYFGSRVGVAALLILLIVGVTAAAELLLGRASVAAWYASYCLLAAWLFSPVALWAEHHSQLRWPMLFPCFAYLTGIFLTEIMGIREGFQAVVGLHPVRGDFGSLAPAAWRALLVVPLLHLLLYRHAFQGDFRIGPFQSSGSGSVTGAAAQHQMVESE
jgi:hypothetical protein